jgi:PAS domain S-box-containing protein
MFGYGDYHLGHGIVGGPLIPAVALSRRAAEAAVRILAGEPPDAFRPEPMPMNAPSYDGRELNRWNISEDRLPKGATVLFRNPTLWSQYQGYVVGAGSLIVLQGLLIGGLIVQRKRGARTESELRESESRFRATADSAPVMIWMAGADRQRDYCNKVWLDYTGRDEAQERGNGWTENVHPEDLQRYLDAYNSAFDARRPFEIEYRLRRHDGQYRWMLSRGVPRYGASGAFLGFTGSSLDITDRKQVEEGMQELGHVSRLAMLGELTASIAHEINQPLGAIRSNADAAEILLESGTDRIAEVRQILDDIRRDDVRASEVVHRIRGLLQKHEPQNEACDLNAVVRDCVRMVGGDAARRHITIETQLAPVPALHGDRFRIQQVLLNLILNGMDAMASTPPARRLISIRTERGRNGAAEVAVADRGTGIPQHDLHRIFDSFYTTKEEGMGLGLAIARFMVEAQGGRIWAENRATGGAVFHCELPLSRPASASERT